MPDGLPPESLHDAEVKRLVIDHHGPTVEMVVEANAQTPGAREYGVRFIGVTELELGDIHTQNVLFDLEAEQTEAGDWQVTVSPSVGIGGSLRCASIEHE